MHKQKYQHQFKPFCNIVYSILPLLLCFPDIKVSPAPSSGGQEGKQLLFLAIKKVEFYLGWSQKCGMILQSVLPELRLEHGK